MENKRSKKALWIGLFVAFVFGILLPYGMWIAGRKYLQQKFEEQVNLGNRYLEEQDYEAAVVAFNKAIEIDPRQPDVYLKLAEAYVVLTDYENAVQTLEKGYQYTSLSEMLEQKKFCEFLMDKWEMISQIAELIQEGSRNSIWERLSQDDYQEFLTHLQRILIQKIEDKFLLFYPCGHCYYGEMEKGIRFGHGIWCSYDYEQADYYDGLWEEDYPNGDGEYWVASISRPNDLAYYHTNWKDGYEEGNVEYEYTTYDMKRLEISTEKFSYSSSEGRPERVNDQHPEQGSELEGKYWYCFHSDEENSYYAHFYEHRGILHVRKSRDDRDTEETVLSDEIESRKRMLAQKLEEYQELKELVEEEAKNGAKLITDQAEGGIMQYDPERQWILVSLEIGKGNGAVKSQIMDFDGNVITKGYQEELWITDSGYAKMEYYYEETGAKVDYEDIGLGMWDNVMYYDNSENVYACVSSYDWDNQLIDQTRLGDDWRYWFIEAEAYCSPKRSAEVNENIICEETQTGYIIKNLEGIEIGHITGINPIEMEVRIMGNILELKKDELTDRCIGIYFCR